MGQQVLLACVTHTQRLWGVLGCCGEKDKDAWKKQEKDYR